VNLRNGKRARVLRASRAPPAPGGSAAGSSARTARRLSVCSGRHVPFTERAVCLGKLAFSLADSLTRSRGRRVGTFRTIGGSGVPVRARRITVRRRRPKKRGTLEGLRRPSGRFAKPGAASSRLSASPLMRGGRAQRPPRGPHRASSNEVHAAAHDGSFIAFAGRGSPARVKGTRAGCCRCGALGKQLHG